jgi:hypothetical protein
MILPPVDLRLVEALAEERLEAARRAHLNVRTRQAAPGALRPDHTHQGLLGRAWLSHLRRPAHLAVGH